MRSRCRFAQQPIVWTASGSVFVIEEAAQQLAELEKQIGLDPGGQASFSTPDLPVIRQNVARFLKNTMAQCYGSALPYGVNQKIPNGPQHPFIEVFSARHYTALC